MIDLSNERLVALREAAKHLPPCRGRRPHIATLYRWASRGFAGEQLETCRIGRTRFTSVEAIERFVRRINEEPDPGLLERDTTDRASNSVLEQELEAKGW
jgi:uncharacterized protein DUF1580